jgi:four helix bundle protein
MAKSDFYDEVEKRTKTLSLRCIKVYRSLDTADFPAQHMGKQLVRCSTSVAANYRAVRRGRSDAEFFSKLSITVEEADETAFWLEMLVFAEIIKEEKVTDLIKEANEIVAILATSRKTMKERRRSGSVK